MSLRQNVDNHTCANSLAFLETITRISSRISDCFSFFRDKDSLCSPRYQVSLEMQIYACFCLQGDGIKLSTHSGVLIGMNFSGKNYVSFLFKLITTLSSF